MSDLKARVRAYFDAGEFRQCRELALQGIAGDPDDLELLRFAGRAGVETGAADAAEQLRRVADRAPDAESWRDLGDALATEGRMQEADAAFRKVLELSPNDELALTNLGHLAYASGQHEEGVALLSRAAEGVSRASTAAISLVDMYRALGQVNEALAAAQRIADAAPDDLVAWLDVAELSLAGGRLDDAVRAFARIREIDDIPGHEIYPLHGLIAVEIARERWQAALTLAQEAAPLDAHGRSAEISEYLSARLAGAAGAGEGASAAEIEGALAASLAEFRRIHVATRSLPPEATA